MMMRALNWEQMLQEHIDEHQRQKFEWGRHDCMTFVLDWVEKCTGRRLFPNHRGYDSEFSSMRRLASLGCRDVSELLRLELDEIPTTGAMRGDIGTYRDQRTGALAGVIFVSHRVVGLAQAGLVWLPASHARHAFKVE